MENNGAWKLFSVYKVENGDRILLGGLVERRKNGRGQSNRIGLLRMARKKFGEGTGEDVQFVLEEEQR